MSLTPTQLPSSSFPRLTNTSATRTAGNNMSTHPGPQSPYGQNPNTQQQQHYYDPPPYGVPPNMMHGPQQPGFPQYYQGYQHPQPYPQQAYPLHPPAPASSFPNGPAEYPFLPTPKAKRSMTLYAADHTTPLFTVVYPSQWALKTDLTIHRGLADGPLIGGATTHGLTTDKVDAWFFAAAGGPGASTLGGAKFMYHFKRRFESQTGLNPAPGKRMEWRIENKALVLAEEKEKGGSFFSGWGSAGNKGESDWVARYVARDEKRIDKETKRVEGRLEVRRGGLTAQQFEEIFVTMVAEMERQRQDNDDWDKAEKFLKLSDKLGGSGA
ncbi:hypothetical protein VTI74DRAFT_7434 [Chaetomium olivicolor]